MGWGSADGNVGFSMCWCAGQQRAVALVSNFVTSQRAALNVTRFQMHRVTIGYGVAEISGLLKVASI